LGEPGQTGCATIFGAKASQHTRFASQLCADILRQKYVTDQGMRWEWTMAPGAHNDLGDAYSGTWVCAATYGLSSDGIPLRPLRKMRVKRRKAKVQMEGF